MKTPNLCSKVSYMSLSDRTNSSCSYDDPEIGILRSGLRKETTLQV